MSKAELPNSHYNELEHLAMTEALKQWQGRVLDVQFPLHEYLGGSENSAVFVTERRAPELQKAAIKLVRIDPRQAEWELSRAESAAALSHSGLIRTHQVGIWRGEDSCLLYVVMEYASEDLSRVLSERPLSSSEMYEVLVSAAGALAYMHQEGLVHGHLKPGNVMAIDDRVKISCDGLSRIGEAAGLRRPSLYDPPEAASGMMTPAGDIWALTMVMVEALTQQLPVWEGTSRKSLILPATLATPFIEIAHDCLQVDPRRRATACQIAQWLRQNPAVTIGAPRATPDRSSTRRRYTRPLTVLGATAALLLIGNQLFYPHSGSRPTVSTLSERSEPARYRAPTHGLTEVRRPSPFDPRQTARRPFSRGVSHEASMARTAKGPDLPAPATGKLELKGGPLEVTSADSARSHRTSSPLASAALSDLERSTATGQAPEAAGRASFFSSSANGGLTASGIRLNSSELIAGHARYPLGTWVRVTNLSNGREVEVRIVDRIPETSGRIINVSETAARQLGFIRAGTAEVRLEVVQRPASLSTTEP